MNQTHDWGGAVPKVATQMLGVMANALRPERHAA